MDSAGNGKQIEVGRGRQSVVRAEGNKAWKEYNDSVPAIAIAEEAKRTRAAAETGFSVSQVLAVEEHRLGLERIDGPTMLAAIKRPWDFWTTGRRLGQLHARMHQHSCLKLPNQKEALRRRIQQASSVPSDVKQRLLSGLPKAMPDPRLCHGDFHPGNVILHIDGPVVIDWANATSGWPVYDVTRTVLLLLGAAHGTYHRPLAVRCGILILLGGYKSGYRNITPLSDKDLKRWLPIAAAVRLSEKIEEEKNYLQQWLHDA